VRDWHVDVINAGGLARALSAGQANVMLFRTLATLRTDIVLFRDVDELKYRGRS